FYADRDLWLDRVHPGDVDRVREAYRGLFSGSSRFEVEYRFQRQDGTWIWLYDRTLGAYETNGVACADGVVSDITQRKQGELELEPIDFGLRDCLDDTMRILAVRAHGKGLELACHVMPDVPDALIGDPGRLRQVLINLVGNAIKFTERGEVVVRVEGDAAPAD